MVLSWVNPRKSVKKSLGAEVLVHVSLRGWDWGGSWTGGVRGGVTLGFVFQDVTLLPPQSR